MWGMPNNMQMRLDRIVGMFHLPFVIAQLRSQEQSLCLGVCLRHLLVNMLSKYVRTQHLGTHSFSTSWLATLPLARAQQRIRVARIALVHDCNVLSRKGEPKQHRQCHVVVLCATNCLSAQIAIASRRM